VSAPKDRGRSRTAFSGRRKATLVVALVLLSGLSVPGAGASPRVSLPTIARQVMCVTCKIPLNVAQSAQAHDERVFIQELIDRGQTEAQIKRALVGQYGQQVLALPSTHGFELAAYLVPAIAVLALIATLAMLLPRWSRRVRPTDAPTAALSRAENERLDADLKRFD
jgi:cytochrome c-type biogenesis protein CcmH